MPAVSRLRRSLEKPTDSGFAVGTGSAPHALEPITSAVDANRTARRRDMTPPDFVIGQPAGGGCRSIFGRLSLMHAHVGADEVQMVAAGFAISGSSSVPARTKIRCGRISASLNSAVPQLGQKRRCITLPLSATLR